MTKEEFERSGLWGGIDFGIGFVQNSFSGIEKEESLFFSGFEGGFTLNPHLLVGVELSGWLLEASDLYDPSKGEGLSQLFLITRYYPSRSMGFFTKLGGGYASYWNNRPGEPRRKEGWGLVLGGGYDFPLNQNIAITPFINYGFGETEGQDHSAWTIGIGLTFQ